VHGPTDDYRMGIVTGVTPTVATAIPHWGGTGTTNYATSQVATGGTSYTAPVDLASVTVTGTSTGFTLGFDQVSLAQDASGFTNGGYGIVYNNTDANKRAIGYVEISSTNAASLVAGPVVITFNSDATAGTAFQVVQS
jgi:hypothetical protein